MGRCEEKNDRKMREGRKIGRCDEEDFPWFWLFSPHLQYQVVGSHTSPPPPNPIEINQELIMFPMGVRDEVLGGELEVGDGDCIGHGGE